MTRDGLAASMSSNNSNCAAVLCLAKTLKLAPPGASVAPRGKLLPRSQTESFIGSAAKRHRRPTGPRSISIGAPLVFEALGIDFGHSVGARQAGPDQPLPASPSLWHGTRLSIPDLCRVLGDRTVAGKLAGPCNIQNRLAGPCLAVRVQFAEPLIGVEIGF